MSVPAPMQKPMNTGRPIAVASNVLLNKYGEVLLGLRADNNLWEIPGGKVEAESVIEAGRREMLEETGIRLLGAPLFLGLVDTWDAFGVNGLPWHLCNIFLWLKWSGEPQLLEGKHLQWKWFKLDGLSSLEEMNYGTAEFTKCFVPLLVQLSTQAQEEWDTEIL